MANKRDFKKYVDYIGSATCQTMLDVCDCVENADKKSIQEAIDKVILAMDKARSKADVYFDKGVKAYPSLKEYSKAKKAFFKQLYKKINEDFNKEIEEGLKVLNGAVPPEVKEENKKG